MTNITPNFNRGELIGITKWETLPGDIRNNLLAITNRLQVLRDLVGKPIKISSGYRTPERNRQIGGAPDSWHVKGGAVDIPREFIPNWLLTQLESAWSGGMGTYDHHIHLDIGLKRRWSGTSK